MAPVTGERARRPGARRSVPADRADRHRRVGPGLPGRRRPAPPARRGQGAAPGAGRRPDVPAPLPGRGAGRGRPQPPQPRGRLRLGPGRPAVPGRRSTWRAAACGPSSHGDGGRLLSVSQALVVGLEAARGLDYAHRRGLRPPRHQARQPALRRRPAAADRRLRPGPGAGRGRLDRAGGRGAGHRPLRRRPSRRPASALDGRSDVYSLALVLVECVTGRVPHAADTAIASLQARIGRSIEAPPELGPLGPDRRGRRTGRSGPSAGRPRSSAGR